MLSSTNSLVLSLKVALISIGAVSLVMVGKSFIPLVLYELPTVWSAVVAWLKPPYLYVVINGIIIIIAATSRSSTTYDKEELSGSEHLQPLITARTPPPLDLIATTQSVQREVFEAATAVPYVHDEEQQVVEVIKPVVLVNDSAAVAHVYHDEDVNDKTVISKSVMAAPTLPETKTETELLLLTAMEKPLVSSRFSHRKPPVKTSPQGVKSLKVTRSKKPETLDNTWKMITEGRHVPLTKLDTFHETRHVTVDTLEEETENITTVTPPHHHRPRHVLKSETFKDRTNYHSPVTAEAKIKKEPSPSAEELNRRVEAFIKKFNEDMREYKDNSLYNSTWR